jgi:integrase
MTTPATISNKPTRKIFEKVMLNCEIKVAVSLEKFEQDQKKEGRAKETIKSRLQSLKQVANLVDLHNPEEVKTWLSDEKRCKWGNKTKVKFCDTYSAYLRFRGTSWQAPKYQVVNKLPFIPTEQEIDLLISGCGKTTATVLQMLKETGMRIGELTQLKWIDLDTVRKTISITPEKGSNPRILPVSDKLLGMLSKLPKSHGENIFQPKKHMIREYFCTQRKKIAERLQNPRLLKISFHTLRHWKGTMEYHKLKDLRAVQKILGHKSILTTQTYENTEAVLFLQDTDEWICRVAHNETEAISLIEAGFQYVNNLDNCALYRKRK